MEISENSNMGGNSHVFQLMTGKFANDPGIRSHFFHMVKYRNPDISNQNGIHSRFFSQMIDQSGNSAFSLSSGNSNDLVPEALEKQLCLG